METKILNFFEWYQKEQIQNVFGVHIDILSVNQSTETVHIFCPYGEIGHLKNLIEKYHDYLKTVCKTIKQFKQAENFRDLVFFKFVNIFSQNNLEKLKFDTKDFHTEHLPYLCLNFLTHDFTFQWNIQVLDNSANPHETDFTPYADIYEEFKFQLFQAVQKKLILFRNECLQHLLSEEEINDNIPCLQEDLNQYKDYNNELCQDYIICKRVSADNLEGYFFQLTDA